MPNRDSRTGQPDLAPLSRSSNIPGNGGVSELDHHQFGQQRAATLYFLGLFVLCAARPGADLEHYLDWAKALSGLDPGLIEGQTLSPVGFPVSHWSPGPGLFFALPRILVGPAVDWNLSLQIMTALASTSLVALIAMAAWQLLGRDRSLVVLALGLLLGGTNFGYYTLYASSELLVLLLVTSPTLLLRLVPTPGWTAFLLLGGSAALLFLSRPQALPMLLPATALLLCRAAATKGPTSRAVPLQATIAACLSALGLASLLLLDYWMTGSPFRSPHSFGDETFRSITLMPRFLSQLLFSERVGLVRFHSISLLGVALAAVRAFRNRQSDHPEAAYHAALVMAFLLQVWITSGYYAWSGGWSVGSRYFLPLAALLIFPVLELLTTLRSRHPGPAWCLTLFVGLAAFPTAASLVPAWTLAGASLLAALVHWAPIPTGRPDGLLTGLAHCVGTALFLVYLGIVQPRGLAFVFAVATGGLFLLSCLPSGLPPGTPRPRWERSPRRLTLTQALTIFSVCVLTFLTFALATFARFLPAANAYRARQLSHPDARYAYVAPFHIENFAADTKEASRSYEMSPRDLAMMRSFLERAKTDAKARRQNVEQGRRDGVGPSTEPQ